MAKNIQKLSLANKLAQKVDTQSFERPNRTDNLMDIEDLLAASSPQKPYTRKQRQLNEGSLEKVDIKSEPLSPTGNPPKKKRQPPVASRVILGSAVVVKCKVVPDAVDSPVRVNRIRTEVKQEPVEKVKQEPLEEVKQEPFEEVADTPEAPEQFPGVQSPHPLWFEQLENVRVMRNSSPAPVDTMGCHRCADPQADPKTLDTTTESSFKEYAATIKSKLLAGELKPTDSRGRSKVWDTFSRLVNEDGIVTTDVVVCNICKNIYKFEKSTSNLVKHKCYIMANSRKRSPPDVDVPSESKKICTNLAMEWTIKNGRPFNLIADSGFKNLAQFFISVGAKLGENVNIDSVLPHPTTISRNIGTIYDFHFNEVRIEIEEQREYGYSITSDIWTDDFFKESYISLTMHYVKEGTLKNRLLAVKSMGGASCTGNEIKNKVERILRDFGCDLLMDDPIIVTDRGANTNAAFNGLSTIHCANRLIHNAIGKVVNEVPELLDLVNRCSKLVKYLKKCGQNWNLTSSLKSYRPTRWNSIFNLLKPVELNWMEISQILEEKNEISRITDINVINISGMVNLLASFECCSKKLEDSNYPTLHLTVPHINNLKNISSPNDNDIEIVKKCKLSLLKYLDSIVIENLKKYHNIALFLFPPTNKLTKFSELEKGQTFKDVEEMMKNIHINNQNDNEEEELIKPTQTIDNIFSDYSEPIQSTNILSYVQDELRTYKNVNKAYSEDFDVLQWWSINKDRFPRLYQISCKILAAPASSAASERAFSVAKNLIREKRSKIDTTEDMTQRFQHLVALMLSSQTKDQTTYDAMNRLKERTLTPQSLNAMPVAELEQLLHPVCFYKNKAKYLKQTVQILIEKYDSDIPDNPKELIALPGVGPKMAHICMAVAFNKVTGIGVDVHVHRISNRLGWVPNPTKEPEQTRVALQKWLPQSLWMQVNHLFVGFGQTVCTPTKPNCGDCLNKHICPSAGAETQRKKRNDRVVN